MDEAALTIAIMAVFVSLAVAGFAIWLQWQMFRASSDQLVNIGKENATLAANIATSLGQIQQTTTFTQDAVGRQMEQMTGRLMDKALADRERVAEEAEPAEGPQAPVEGIVAQWKVTRIVSEARIFEPVRSVLTYLNGEDEGKSHDEIRHYIVSTYEKPEEATISAALDLFRGIGSLSALDAFEYKGDKLVLTETGKLAARLYEELETGDPPQSAT